MSMRFFFALAVLCCLLGAAQLSAQANASTGAVNYATAPGNSFLDEYYFDVDFGPGTVNNCDLSITFTNTAAISMGVEILVCDNLADMTTLSEYTDYDFGVNYNPTGAGSSGAIIIWGPNAVGFSQGNFPLTGVVRFNVLVTVTAAGSTFPNDITVSFTTSIGANVSTAAYPVVPPNGVNMGYNIWSQVTPTTAGVLPGWGRAGDSDYFQRNHSNFVTGSTRFGSASDQMQFFIDVDLGTASAALDMGLIAFAYTQPGTATGDCIVELYDMQEGWDTPVATATSSTASTGVLNGDYATCTTGTLTGLARFRIVMRGQNLSGVAYGATTFAVFGFELYISDAGQAQSVTNEPVIAAPRMAITPPGSTQTSSPVALTATGGTPTVSYNWTLEGAVPAGVSLSASSGATVDLLFGGSTPQSSTVTVRCTNGVGPEFTEETYTLDFVGGAISIVATDSTAGEPADNGAWTITFSTVTTASTTVDFTMTGTATLGALPADYTLSVPAGSTIVGSTLTVPGGTASVVVTLAVNEDAVAESTKDAVMTLNSANQAYTIGSPASGTIVVTDDDGGPVIPLVTISAAGTPSETGPTSGTYTLTATPPPAAPIQVNVALSGTAVNGTDFTATGITGGQVTIGVGGSATVTIAPIDDSAVESTESVILTVSAGTGYTPGTVTSATLNITDNDTAIPPPTLGGGGGGGGSCAVTGDSSNWMAAIGLLVLLAIALRVRYRRE